jgi:hypothetical protein
MRQNTTEMRTKRHHATPCHLMPMRCARMPCPRLKRRAFTIAAMGIRLRIPPAWQYAKVVIPFEGAAPRAPCSRADRTFGRRHGLRRWDELCNPLPLTPAPILGLGADRKDVRHDHEPLWDATRVRRSHPAPILGAGPGVRAKTRIPTPQAPNLSTCSVRP